MTVHVPTRYESIVRLAIGNTVLIYRPSGGTPKRPGAYIGLGTLAHILSGTGSPRFSMVVVDICMFSAPVVASSRRVTFERSLREPNWISFAQRIIRPISDDEMLAILPLGGALEPVPSDLPGLAEDEHAFVFEPERERSDGRLSRIVRSVRERREARQAYDNRCALTQTRFELSPGIFEAEWSHWWPVRLNGPDVLANASMLSSTAHRMVENGLVGLDGSYRLVGTMEALRYLRLLNPTLHPFLPADPRQWPSQRFLSRHRARHARKHRWVGADQVD